MVMIFAGGHISGGHFNPAVTLGVWLRGKCAAKDVAPYMIFQTLGAVLAAFAVKFLKGGAAVTPLQPATVPALLAVSLHFCAGLRGTEHCHGQRYIRQLLLWAGHWVHGASGGVFRWQHFRWSVQSSGGSGHLLYATVPLAEYLDLPCG